MKTKEKDRPRFEVLGSGQRARLGEMTLEVLERTGVHVSHRKAVDLLGGAGAHLERETLRSTGAMGYRARIPSWLVEDAIRSAPANLMIYDRNGTLAMRLGGQRCYFGANMDAPLVYDPFSHRHRPQQEEDCRRHALLIDALPHFDFVMSAGFAADRPATLSDRYAAMHALISTTRPVLVITLTMESLAAVREMAAVIAGSDDSLRRRPFLLHYSEPISPLLHPDESICKLLYCAEWQIPLVYTPYLAMGATAPCSMAGALAQACAESLSGLVIHQLACRGAPFIFGAMPSIMDMGSTIFSYAAPELHLMLAGMAEMARHFGLPNFGTAGCGDSCAFDGQAVLEATTSCIWAALSGAQLIHDTGLFGSAQVVIPEMYVVVDEILGMLEPILQGISLEDAESVTDLIDEIGPGGEYVTHTHTLAHFRSVWYPRMLARAGLPAWQEKGSIRFEERIHQRMQELLEYHRPPCLADEVSRQLAAISASWV